jgi:hypothetical protein
MLASETRPLNFGERRPMTRRMHLATRTLSLTLAALLSLGAAGHVAAADADATTTGAAPEKPITEVTELDEIMVRGTNLRDLIAEAEDEFFRAFNTANKDDDFDTSCVDIPLDGNTRIKSRACIPGFYADAMADQVYFMQACQPDREVDREGNVTEYAATACYLPPTPQAVLTERAKEYANHMLRVIRSDANLQRMAGRLDELYYDLLDVQRQYVKVKTSADSSPAPAQSTETQAVH